jgi:hypothetical protein
MMSATAVEAVTFKNISASTAAFALRGGKYAVVANATGTGSMGLQMLAADGSTFVPAHTAFVAVTGFTTVDLPPGSYKFVMTGFTAVFASICRISS